MKNTVKFLSIFILFSCSPSEEELKIAIDEIYNQVKTIPSSKPCENLDGYKNLEAYESRSKTNFYSELTSQKIKLYEEECSKKIGYTLRVGGRDSGINDKRNWDRYLVGGKNVQISDIHGLKMQGFPLNWYLSEKVDVVE